MLFLIIAVNLSISLLNLYIAIRIWQLRILTTRINAILINYERYFNLVLSVAPRVIYRGQNNIYLTRQRYQLLQLRASQIRQLILLLNQSYRIWRRI